MARFRVLVSFEEVPEDSVFFVLEVEDLEALRKMHRRYINISDDCEDIKEMFYKEDGYFKFEKVENPSGHFDLVISTGIYL